MPSLQDFLIYILQQQFLFYAIIWILFKDTKNKKLPIILSLIAYEILRFFVLYVDNIPYLVKS